MAEAAIEGLRKALKKKVTDKFEDGDVLRCLLREGRPGVKECFGCGGKFDPAKDMFITVHERKGPSLNFDTLACATKYVNDED